MSIKHENRLETDSKQTSTFRSLLLLLGRDIETENKRFLHNLSFQAQHERRKVHSKIKFYHSASDNIQCNQKKYRSFERPGIKEIADTNQRPGFWALT